MRKEQEEGGMFLGRDQVSVTVPEKSACHCRFWTLYTSWSAEQQKHDTDVYLKILKCLLFKQHCGCDAECLSPVQLSSSLWSEQSKKPSHLSLSSTHASRSAHSVPFTHTRGSWVATQRAERSTQRKNLYTEEVFRLESQICHRHLWPGVQEAKLSKFSEREGGREGGEGCNTVSCQSQHLQPIRVMHEEGPKSCYPACLVKRGQVIGERWMMDGNCLWPHKLNYMIKTWHYK